MLLEQARRRSLERRAKERRGHSCLWRVKEFFSSSTTSGKKNSLSLRPCSTSKTRSIKTLSKPRSSISGTAKSMGEKTSKKHEGNISSPYASSPAIAGAVYSPVVGDQPLALP